MQKLKPMKKYMTYIYCKECKKIGFNDDDNVCIYCGSKETYRVVRPKATKLFKE